MTVGHDTIIDEVTTEISHAFSTKTQGVSDK